MMRKGLLVTLAIAGCIAIAGEAAGEAVPDWQKLLEQQLLEQEKCQVEYLVGTQISGQGADEKIETRAHCRDGRNFDAVRDKRHMKFRLQQCSENYC